MRSQQPNGRGSAINAKENRKDDCTAYELNVIGPNDADHILAVKNTV
jgi:hypothetical protein